MMVAAGPGGTGGRRCGWGPIDSEDSDALKDRSHRDWQAGLREGGACKGLEHDRDRLGEGRERDGRGTGGALGVGPGPGLWVGGWVGGTGCWWVAQGVEVVVFVGEAQADGRVAV